MIPAPLQESIFESELYLIPDQKIVVILDRPWKTISLEERSLLEKILKAIQLNTDSVNLLEAHQIDVNKIANSQRLIAFGWNPNGNPLFEQQNFGHGQMVYSESLELLARNDESKKRLWQALKKLFSA